MESGQASKSRTLSGRAAVSIAAWLPARCSAAAVSCTAAPAVERPPESPQAALLAAGLLGGAGVRVESRCVSG